MKEAYFHIVRELEFIDTLAARLYGSSDAPNARDFLRINAVVTADGYAWPGTALYLPDPVCYGPEMEARVTEMVRAANGEGLQMLSMPERQFLAANVTFTNNTAKNAQPRKTALELANTGASGLLAATSLQTKIMSSSLRKLEQRYVQEFRQYGKLTPHFFAERQRAYQTLDTALGRTSRMLTMGTPLDAKAKSVLKINAKSQILYWKRNGTGDGVRDFVQHFDKMKQHARFFKAGGYLTVGIDGYFTYDKITEACRVSSERECHRVAAVEGGGFAGRFGGGLAGGSAAYIGCNTIFGGPTFGSSLLWCGIVAGGAGGVAGGTIVGEFGKAVGKLIHELIY